MQKASNIPTTAGVYILLNEVKKLAYVGKCANIRHRAAVWDHHFKKLSKNSNHTMPVRDWPADTNSADWQFGAMPGYEEHVVRQALRSQGYTFINEKTRNRELINYKGRSMTLREHADAENIPYTKAYYRFRAGKPLDEVFK